MNCKMVVYYVCLCPKCKGRVDRIWLSITATIVSCHEVVIMSGYFGILMPGLRNGGEAVCLYHLQPNSCAEFLYLFSNVLQESITALSTNEHDHEDRHSHEVH